MNDQALLNDLLQNGRIWRGRTPLNETAQLISSGFDELDALLGGGWPLAGMLELFSEGAVGLPLLLPLIARQSRLASWVAWIAPPYVPYAPGLQHHGVDLSRILLVKSGAEQALWAAEQALRSGTCSLVLLWQQSMEKKHMRRLQLAAEAGHSLGILFRPESARSQPSVAGLRLHMRMQNAGMQVQVLKRRGGWAGEAQIVPCCG